MTLDPTQFARLGLGPAALQAIAGLGYEVPTAVQSQAIPLLVSGRDVIAQAPTGTGKTAAYGLPIVEHLNPQDPTTQALVVVPTRELAIQVTGALAGMGRHRRMTTLAVYGGAAYEGQLRALRQGVQVVVGTPGRLLDHLSRGTLVLDTAGIVVLDEADEMLNMGFLEDIERLLAALPADHQTALFSATIPVRIKHLARQYLRSPEHVMVEAGNAVGPDVRQVYYEVNWTNKPEALARILDFDRPESAIVFVRTRKDADQVAEQLSALGHSAQAIHGDISQPERERVLGRFRAGQTRLLVGTDVAARGLDISDVSHVINYDLPADAEAYTHRVGRTGRAGQKGDAITLVTPRERAQLVNIERGINRKLQRLQLPSDRAVADRRLNAFRDRVLEVLEAGDLDFFSAMVADLAGEHDIAAVASAALKLAAGGTVSQMPAGPAPDVTPQARPAGYRSSPRPAGAIAENSTRLFLRVGRRHGVRPADVVGAIANEAGIPWHAVGEINLYDTFSFVDVPESSAATVEAALNRSLIRGHQPRATVARPSAHPLPSPRRAFKDRRQ